MWLLKALWKITTLCFSPCFIDRETEVEKTEVAHHRQCHQRGRLALVYWSISRITGPVNIHVLDGVMTLYLQDTSSESCRKGGNPPGPWDYGVEESQPPFSFHVCCLEFAVVSVTAWVPGMALGVRGWKMATFLPLKTLFIICLCTYAYSTVYLCRSEDNLWEFILLPCEFWALKSGQQA